MITSPQCRPFSSTHHANLSSLTQTWQEGMSDLFTTSAPAIVTVTWLWQPWHGLVAYFWHQLWFEKDQDVICAVVCSLSSKSASVVTAQDVTFSSLLSHPLLSVCMCVLWVRLLLSGSPGCLTAIYSWPLCSTTPAQSSLCEIGQPASVGANKYLPESISCVFLSLSTRFSPVPQLSPPGQIRVPVHTASSSAHTTPKTSVFTRTTSHTFP